MVSSSEERAVLVAAEGEGVEGQELFSARRRRRLVVFSAVGLGMACTLVLLRSQSRCSTSLASSTLEGSVMSLVQTYPTELGTLAEAGDDLDSRKQWLAEANAAKERLSEALPAQGRVPAEVQHALDDALGSDDPERARLLVDRAVQQAVEESKRSRRNLKHYLKAHRRSLKGKSEELSPAKQVAIATCVLNSLSATTTLAGIAANFNDAAKTCWGVEPENLFRFGLKGKAWVHTNVCAVNVWAILGGVIGLAGTLSGLASDCAATLIPNINALCGSAVIGLVTAVAGMGGAATLVKAACFKKGWYRDIPKGAVPSNVGNNEFWISNHLDRKAQYDKEMAAQAALAGHTRRLDEDNAAPARQLLFGGGKGSTATQCAVELSGILWALSSAALSINSAGNLEDGATCPPKNFLTGSEKPSNSILYKVPQALCTVDVTSALLGFLGAITYMMLASVNCIDTLSLGAICGSGITGLMATASGVAKAGAAMYITCDVAQKKPIKRTIGVARNIDTATNGMLGSLTGSLGRRLDEDEDLMVSIAEDNIRDLQQRFASPHEALRSIGIDLDDASAPWRNATAPAAGTLGDVQSLMSLLQLDGKKESLFGEQACQ